MSFDISDIRRVQAQRPDLDDSQAGDVLGFLLDMYSIESFDIKDNERLFKETAEFIYPEGIK